MRARARKDADGGGKEEGATAAGVRAAAAVAAAAGAAAVGSNGIPAAADSRPVDGGSDKAEGGKQAEVDPSAVGGFSIAYSQAFFTVSLFFVVRMLMRSRVGFIERAGLFMFLTSKSRIVRVLHFVRGTDVVLRTSSAL